jgi:Ca2+/Na+ antiporter
MITNLAVKISLLSSGLFLLLGMLIGIIKYQRMFSTPEHQAPVYINIAHRAALLYSFAMLVVAALLQHGNGSPTVQLGAALLLLIFLVLTIFGYLAHGLRNKTDNMFRERNFITTWYMYLLIAGEIGGLSIILWGFISAQFGGVK